jgi:predicted acyl esterase
VYGANTGVAAVEFRSPPLALDLELVGPLLLELYAATSGFDTAFRAELYVEPAPGAPRVLVSSGQLRASLRNLAAPLGADMQASHLFTAKVPVAAGRVLRYDIALQPIAWRVLRGSRLILRIAQIDDSALHGNARSDTLYHSTQFPSRLHLPVLPDARVPQTNPFAPFVNESQGLQLPPQPPDPEPQPEAPQFPL